MAIVGEYRFVFTDEVSKSRGNESLSSTTAQEEKQRSDTKSKPEPAQWQKTMGKYAKGGAAALAMAGTAISVYTTVRNVAYNRKTTDAIISGNLQAASYISANKARQDKIISMGMSAGKGIVAGAMIGSAVPGIGTAIGAVVGMVGGIAKDLYRMNNQHREEMRRFMNELSEQRYSGYLESRRLVNMTGKVR